MVNAGRARYLWVVVAPMAFVTTTTMTAGVQLIQRFWALGQSPVAADSFKGYLNAFLIVAMMVSVAIILWESVRRWLGPTAPSPIPSGKAAEA
jgi:carbon starvation protein CstA